MGYARLQTAGDGFQNSAREVAQMRGEDHLRTKVSSDFRLMAMGKHAIRLQAHLTKAVGNSRLTSRAAHAAGGVNYRPLAEIQQPGINQWFQRQLRRRRVATRHGNQIRVFQLVCAPLRQSINRLLQQVGMLMGKAVIFFIERAVVYAKRTREVKHHASGLQKLRGQVMAHLMCRCEEHNVHPCAKLADI